MNASPHSTGLPLSPLLLSWGKKREVISKNTANIFRQREFIVAGETYYCDLIASPDLKALFETYNWPNNDAHIKKIQTECVRYARTNRLNDPMGSGLEVEMDLEPHSRQANLPPSKTER